MSKRSFLIVVLFSFLALGWVGLAAASDAPLSVWVKRNYSSWDNPLHSEFIVNGKTINIFTSDTIESVEEHFKPGWNTITIKTTPQVPASKDNHLTMRIGPMRKEGNKMIMDPVLWQIGNGTDWKFADGNYSHPLGPDVKEVTLTYNLYYVGPEPENKTIKAGDYVLSGTPTYASWNSPVTAAVTINGTPLNSFALAGRTIVITPYLKQGKNEIKLVSTRVKNSIRDNDIAFQILGPAEWNVQQGKFLLAPVMQFKTKQGWTMDAKSGLLINPIKPDSETIERVIPFMLKEAPVK
ncbi:MAG: hypothetical protein ACR2L2_17330 [Acidobacteriota bacterium]